MSPEAAELKMRSLAYSGSRDHKTLALLTRRALEGEPRFRHSLEKWLAMHEAGRQVRVGTFPATFSTVMVPPDLQAEVEDALKQGEQR